jgi:hypothetical protein
MNPFSNFIYNVQTDAQFRKKTFFFIGVGIFLLLLAIFLIQFNFGSSDNASQRPATFGNSLAVTIQDFENAKSLEQVDSKPVGEIKQMLFLPANQTVNLDENLKLKINNQIIDSSPSFSARQMYYTDDGIIINEDGKTSIYNNGQFSAFPNTVSWLTPVLLPDSLGLRNQPGYLYLAASGNGYILKQTEDIKLSKNTKNIAQINPGSEFKVIELRIFNQNPYLILYESPARQNKMEVWQINNQNQLQKVHTLDKIQSVQYGSDRLMFTRLSNSPTELSVYENNFLNFSQNPQGENQPLDLQERLAQNNIYGSLLAERCNLAISSTMYCLVKEKKVSSQIFSERDILVKWNYQESKLDFPVSGLSFSAHTLFVGPDSTIYIVGQENRLLYKLKT